MMDEVAFYQSLIDLAASDKLEFLLIGGHAVNARGYERPTLDLDLLIPEQESGRWNDLMARLDYRLVRESDACVHFRPSEREGLRVDLILVGAETFHAIAAEAEWLDYGGRRVRVASVLHLIALKLHGSQALKRPLPGGGYYDILALSRRSQLQVGSQEFSDILERFASEGVKQRLLSDLQRAVELEFPKPAPQSRPIPSFEEQLKHARFLVSHQPPGLFENRLARMNPEPFEFS